jgi:microsomal dipeptidase-like Zn-dependent dipeptidase
LKKNNFRYADLHCHPNLKTYGHSFDKKKSTQKKDVWYYKPPSFLTKLINKELGITRFSQSDFTSMSKGGAQIIFASLYPFEKGFFMNAAGKGPLSARLSDMVTGIGYQRIRNLQQHTNYFDDLESEYHFFCNSKKSCLIDQQKYSWRLVANQAELKQSLLTQNETAVLLSIEGAHVLNSGLSKYGKQTVEEEVLRNIQKLKRWSYPPFFITFAHNFNNDLCGHAQSLDPIKRFVDQTEGMNSGFTTLGKKALHELLSPDNGRPIYIDIKHMSTQSRNDYFEIINSDYATNTPPTIISHGAVNGLPSSKANNKHSPNIFYPADINFFDEEIEEIGASGGLFAIQFDARRIAKKDLVKKSLKSLFAAEDPSIAATVIWHQIRHIAEVLDRKSMFSWGTACIGSDYDGTIDPIPGIWTAEYFHTLYEGILSNANRYLRQPNVLSMKENQSITPEEIAARFFLNNTLAFTTRFF